MTILVTGANGQVGHELVRRAGDLRVTGLGRATLDITDKWAVTAAIDKYGARILINAAAYTAVDRAESEVAQAFAVNRDGAAALAQACALAGIPLLHLSTDYVFDGSSTEPYAVDAPAAPLGVYGRSKLEGEQAIRIALPEHLIVRVAWVFGAHGANFVRTMLQLARARGELRVVADQWGAPTPAASVADSLLALARRHLAGETLPWGMWHFTGTPVTTWHGFAQAIVEEAFTLGLIARKPVVTAIATADYPTPARRPANSVLSTASSLAALGLEAPDWREGLRDILTEWKQAA